MWGIQFQLKASRHARRGGGGRGGHPIRERDDGGDGGTGATVKGSANKSPCPYGPPGATAAPASVVGGPPRIKNALPPSPENREAAALPPPPPPSPHKIGVMGRARRPPPFSSRRDAPGAVRRRAAAKHLLDDLSASTWGRVGHQTMKDSDGSSHTVTASTIRRH